MAHTTALKNADAHERTAAVSKETSLHEETLTMEQFVLLNSLDHDAGDATRALVAMAETLMDDETLQALQRYEGTFAAADLQVAPALKALPRALALRALASKLELALELTRRNLADTVEPVARTAADVHRFIEGTPEHSRLRPAFAQMTSRWEATFAGGRRKRDARPEAPVNDTTPKPR